MNIKTQTLFIIGAYCAGSIQASDGSNRSTLPDSVIAGTTYTTRSSFIGQGDVVQVSMGDPIVDAEVINMIIALRQQQAQQRQTPQSAQSTQTSQAVTVVRTIGGLQMPVYISGNQAYRASAQPREQDAGRATFCIGSITQTTRPSEAHDAVRTRRSTNSSNVHVSANNICCLNNYNYTGSEVSISNAQIGGDANITSIQRATLTSCVIGQRLNITTPACDLTATSVNSDCILRSCRELIMRNNSIVRGDIHFVDMPGKVVKDRDCTIGGIVVNGSIEERE